LSGQPATAVEEVLAGVGIEDLAGRRLRSLSLGNRQRVGLASAELLGTDAVVVDEPFNGLDPRARARFRDRLRILAASGRTVVVSSHDLTEVENLCDDVVVVDDGAIRFHGELSSYMPSHPVVVVHSGAEHVDVHLRLLRSAGFEAAARGSVLRVRSGDEAAVAQVLGAAGATPGTTVQPADLEDSFDDVA
jgi:ABC-2 type transport system ATP-binding protein